jgi:hypothetical protein
MAVVRPRAEDVNTLICESCGWHERKSVPVADKWTSELGKDYCDVCSARRRCEAKAKRKAKKNERKAA